MCDKLKPATEQKADFQNQTRTVYKTHGIVEGKIWARNNTSSFRRNIPGENWMLVIGRYRWRIRRRAFCVSISMQWQSLWHHSITQGEEDHLLSQPKAGIRGWIPCLCWDCSAWVWGLLYSGRRGALYGRQALKASWPRDHWRYPDWRIRWPFYGDEAQSAGQALLCAG